MGKTATKTEDPRGPAIYMEHPRHGAEIRVKPWFDTSVHREWRRNAARWETVDTYEDAQFTSSQWAGLDAIRLEIAKDSDPETGEFFDCDDQRAKDVVEMISPKLSIHGETLIAEGFVALSSDWDSPQHDEYRIERWTMYPPRAEAE